jgi:dihydroorotate dehydrogenase
MTKSRRRLFGYLYTSIAKPVFFAFEPEFVHNSLVGTGRYLGSNVITKAIASAIFSYQDQALSQNILGINFRNPVGLSAGFDKNAEAAPIMEDVGFGFVELGSITANPCKGNPGVRLKRLVSRKSIWVNLGLNNKGAVEIHKRLKSRRALAIPMGISAAKTNCKETTDPLVGLADYLFTVREFRDIADFFVLNISCPNAFGGQDFADPKLFETLARGVTKLKLRQPVFVKLSPDLTRQNVDRIISISGRYRISGFICSNLTKKHEFSSGGLSGKVVEPKANRLLSYVYRKTREQPGRNFILIGTGGIFSAEDAYDKIKLGANLVELITGMIYQGPQLIGDINYGLVELLERDGFSNISEAVGTANRSEQ